MDISLHFKGGGSFTNHKPAFSSDGENVFVSWKNSILQYSSKTGKLIYEYKGLSSRIAGYSICLYDSYECLIACSETGEVLGWKTNTHFKILEQKISKAFVKTFVVIENVNELTALISYREKSSYRFSVVNIKEETFLKFNIKLKGGGEYFIDKCRDQFFAVAQNNVLYVCNLKNAKETTRHSIDKNLSFTCISCHPTDPVIVTGDSLGRALVWQGIFYSDAAKSVYHWHTLPLKCVGFSTAGSYFYSGGEECVLVKWDLNNSQDKSFLPRLKASLVHITVSHNNVYIAVATDDNAIRILDSRFNEISLIQHLVIGNHLKCGIVLDKRTKALILNGNVGHIQFYNPHDKSLLYNVDIVGQNKITNERECKIANTDVTKIAISKSGLWLATVEERIDNEYSSEIRLKFWTFDASNQTFKLNTSVEYPHEKSVTSIAFQPTDDDSELKLVTVSKDKTYKIWQHSEVEDVHNKLKSVWNCFGVGFYRNLPCKGLSFSIDGSLMAIGFGSILTAWLPDSCELKCSLLHPDQKEKITHVQFGNENQCHLLIGASNNQLSVWNLLTMAMIWTVPVKVNLLVADSLSAHVAVLTTDKKVFVFTPASPEPVFTSEELLKEESKIVTASFIPSKNSNDSRLKWYERSHLYFINKRNELCCISNETDDTLFTSDNSNENYKSLFSEMIPSSKTSMVNNLKPTKHMFENDNGHKDIKKYLEAPVHTMAPIRYTGVALIQSLVIGKDNTY